jgi:hypothetical protein
MGYLSAFFKNFQLSNSVIAGGGASILIYAVGAALVASNVVIPGLGIPLTMGIVGMAAIPLGHLVTALVPDSLKQQVDALGKKFGAQITDLKVVTPQFDHSFPSGKNGAVQTATVSVSNINK